MDYKPQLEFYQKRPFGDKLNATFVFVRENAKPFFRAQLLIAGPILLVMAIIINQFSFDFMGLGLTPEDFTGSDLFRMFKLYGLVLVNAVITSAVMPAVAYSYMKAYQKTEPSLIANSDLTNGLGSRVFNVLGFNILSTIILTIVMFFFSFGIGFTAASDSVLLALLFGLGLTIAVMYVFVALGLGPAIIIFEDNNPIDAIGRCFKLIVGKWWSTFGLIVIVFILGAIINQLFALPRTVFFGIKAFTSFEEGGDLTGFIQMTSGEQALNILFSVFETFGTIISNSLIFIAIAFQYFNLVERKESRGLMSQIEGMDEQANENDDEVY
jgi:hypothetical protein